MESIIFLISLALGSISGVLAGLFGIGGGLVIVPILAMIFKAYGFPLEILLLMSVATSLATIILTSISSVAAHHRLGAVDWSKVFRLTPGIIFGAGMGALIAERIPADGLRYLLILFLCYVGIQMAWQLKPKAGIKPPSRWQDYCISTLIGVMSSIVGIGGGTLTVPYLVHGQTSIQKAVAIASACGLPIAVASSVSYALLGSHAQGLPEWSLGYIYLPAFLGIGLSSICTAPLGAILAHKLPAKQLKRYFSLLLFIMAAKLMWH